MTCRRLHRLVQALPWERRAAQESRRREDAKNRLAAVQQDSASIAEHVQGIHHEYELNDWTRTADLFFRGRH